MTDPRKTAIEGDLTAARNLILNLWNRVPDRDLNRTLHPDFRPLRWHLGHVGMYESRWVIEQAQGGACPDAELCYLFSTENPQSRLEDLPPREEVLAFSTRVRELALEFLEQVDLDAANPLTRDGYVFQNVLTHEYQHVETITYQLQMLELDLSAANDLDVTTEAPPKNREIHVPAGEHAVGRMRADPLFSYDNEWPRHTVQLDEFLLAQYPCTNAEFLEFVVDAGYRRKEFWSPEGWQWKQQTGAVQPLYWRAEHRAWRQKTITGEIALPRAHPVMLIAYYEAEAYARYRGMRLPTEAEWEVAAAWDPDRGRQRTYAWGDEAPNSGRARYGQPLGWTAPVGQSGNVTPGGLHGMTGNIWEWTSTPFDGYPGFAAYPYPEYSQQWFDGQHRVVRGGSFASQAPMLRASFRNWFYPRTRERFIGVRLARTP